MTNGLGLEADVVDPDLRARAVAHFRQRGIRLPTFAELADPTRIPASVRESLAEVDPDAPDPRNLFRVHWYNDESRRGLAAVPSHAVLPPSLTGVPAKIIVAFGDRFPMITAHKVLAAYACLAPRVTTGRFDPTRHRALWPSTGNYCRGGVAISRIMGCHGVAILPEGMSRERFEWLERWVVEDADIVRTPGTESNVKEIYDECNALRRDPQNVIFNQFCEFGNHLAHFHCTGRALAHVFETVREKSPEQIMLNVLDPNREVDPKYLTYLAITDDGRTLTGIIAAETATSITLKRAENQHNTLLRVNIEELKSTGKSIMPEALENEIDHQAMADLIAYLRSLR